MGRQLSIINNNTEELQNQGNTLQQNLTIIKNELENITKACMSPCEAPDLDGLVLDANFNNVPNISKQLSNIQDVVDSDFVGAAEEVKICFTSFKEIGFQP